MASAAQVKMYRKMKNDYCKTAIIWSHGPSADAAEHRSTTSCKVSVLVLRTEQNQTRKQKNSFVNVTQIISFVATMLLGNQSYIVGKPVYFKWCHACKEKCICGASSRAKCRAVAPKKNLTNLLKSSKK